LTGREPLRVNVAGLEPLAGEGLEMRFNVKLRIQNPNDTPLEFQGVSLQLDLNGKPFASGVSDEAGVVPRFGCR
jgi:LEA14-like dessication related protein